MTLTRTVFIWEILSDLPLQTENPADLAYMVTDGGCSGSLVEVSSETVSREHMAELLIAQGSDPEFLLGEVCATEDCWNSLDDGEGWDGYCGSCADRRDAGPEGDGS